MNENLNLVDILKDCPQGTKLYSTIHGEVEFEKIITDSIYSIVFTHRDIVGERYIDYVTEDGRHRIRYCGECTLFPSKNQRDWSKFKFEPEMVDGEFYYCKTKLTECIYIYKKHNIYKNKTGFYIRLELVNNRVLDTNCVVTINDESIKILRKATDEEKEMFFNLLQKNDYKWDADKKELVKIEPKFDISSLQPFDKVLTRDWNDSVWRCNIYEYYKEGQCYPFITMNGVCNQCVPYNNETKHLVSTTEMPPEKYINWEE